MPQYYFQIKSGHIISEDEEGGDFPDLETARAYALRAAREFLVHSIRFDKIPPDCIVVADSSRRELLTVFLVEVVPENIKAQIR